VTPPLAVPLAVVAAIVVLLPQRRAQARWQTIALPLLVAGAPLLMTRFVPGLPPSADSLGSSCYVPTAESYSIARVPALVRDVILAPAGPYVVALAVLGAFTARRLVREPAAPSMAAYVALSLVAAGWVATSPLRALAPALALFWTLAGIGLATLMETARRGPAGRLAAALSLILVPVLQLARPLAPSPQDRVPFGHQGLSLSSFGQLLGAMPDRSVLVKEDAVTDLLLRALSGTWQKSGKSLAVVGRHSPALPGLASTAGVLVYALPAAQTELQNVGFRLTDAPPPARTGLSEVHWAGPCLPLSRRWEDATKVSGSGTVALVAADDVSRGPLELYVAGNGTFTGLPGGPGAAAVGASRRAYAFSNRDDAAHRARDFGDNGVAGDQQLTAAASVLNLEVWRRPGAPAMVPLDLGAVPDYALARYSPGDLQKLSLCPAFPYERKAIQ
jgi:hypothetical protein